MEKIKKLSRIQIFLIFVGIVAIFIGIKYYMATTVIYDPTAFWIGKSCGDGGYANSCVCRGDATWKAYGSNIDVFGHTLSLTESNVGMHTPAAFCYIKTSCCNSLGNWVDTIPCACEIPYNTSCSGVTCYKINPELCSYASYPYAKFKWDGVLQNSVASIYFNTKGNYDTAYGSTYHYCNYKDQGWENGCYSNYWSGVPNTSLKLTNQISLQITDQQQQNEKLACTKIKLNFEPRILASTPDIGVIKDAVYKNITISNEFESASGGLEVTMVKNSIETKTDYNISYVKNSMSTVSVLFPGGSPGTVQVMMKPFVYFNSAKIYSIYTTSFSYTVGEPTCSDGTPYGTCSVTKPKYCSNGTLVDRCDICGPCYCTDGTAYGACSNTKPKYCNEGVLIDKCSVCGCRGVILQALMVLGDTSNYVCNTTDEKCYVIENNETLKCSDGTPRLQCSATKPQYCDAEGDLINKCTLCGCTAGYDCNNATEACVPATPKCSDGTPYGICSVTKPKYCNGGVLIDKCSVCGCPINYVCQTESCVSAGGGGSGGGGSRVITTTTNTTATINEEVKKGPTNTTKYILIAVAVGVIGFAIYQSNKKGGRK